MVERDINFESPALQKRYQEALERIGPAGRVQRTFSLLSSMYQMLSHVVSTQNPGLSGREVRRLVALKLYQGDQATVDIIKKMA